VRSSAAAVGSTRPKDAASTSACGSSATLAPEDLAHSGRIGRAARAALLLATQREQPVLQTISHLDPSARSA
jgi:hypothetical protein